MSLPPSPNPNPSSFLPSLPSLLPLRYLVLLSFSLLTLTSSWLWITFSPLTSLLSHHYSLPPSSINQLSTVFMFTYVLGGLPSIYICERLRLRRSLLIGGGLTTLGAGVRFFGAAEEGVKGFVYAYIGSFIAAVGQLFTLSVPPLLSTLYFPPSSRSLATSIGVLANQSGTALGLGLTGLYVQNCPKDFKNYLGLQTVTGLTSFILIYIYVLDNPPQPPSLAATSRISIPISPFPTYVSEIKKILKLKSLLLSTISYGISTGVFYTLATFLEQLLPSYSDNLISELGLTIVITGLVGSITSGIILDKYRMYLDVLRYLYLASFIFTVLWMGSNVWPIWALFGVAGMMGFMLTGTICTGFEYAVELTFPVNEGTVGGILNVSAQAFGCILIWIGEALLTVSVDWCNGLMVLSLGCACFIMFFVVDDRDYKREAKEKGAENDESRLLRNRTESANSNHGEEEEEEENHHVDKEASVV
ncbi:hypothetical protein TrST_g1606 [Triparma strigata]|uniref:Major facilitator superfamily (MFS) profile domain-containing protein n=1 Tax=Triparma strigata TaxID=1606541 RepID=A0A9W7DYI2_9STRA|nr:hypothetical protein TrST_g1606 [Triparma strigata]